jgi:hypothetical protein
VVVPGCVCAPMCAWKTHVAMYTQVCVFITAVPIIKLFAWGEGDSGGHESPVALQAQTFLSSFCADEMECSHLRPQPQ